MNAIKKIFKLIRLGVFCKWFTNVNKLNPDIKMFYMFMMVHESNWKTFIFGSFNNHAAKEGYEFWRKIANK